MKRTPTASRTSSTVGRASRGAGGRGRFTEPMGPRADAFEAEADRVARAVVKGPGGGAAAGAGTTWSLAAHAALREGTTIRRAPQEGAVGAVEAAKVPAPAEAPRQAEAPSRAEPSSPTASSGRGALLAEDGVDVQPGQMRKGEFLDALRVDLCAAVDEGLAGTGRDSQGCPWIDHWLGYYADRGAAQIERSLTRYAPETAGAMDARDYIRAVAARARRSAQTYAKTGQVTGVPEDVPDGGAMGGAMGGGLLGAFGGMFFKARPGGAREADPVSVRTQLGGGRAMPGAVRSRMESAFGVDFGQVRLHTDARAGRTAEQLNARAFTVGPHVAFNTGEYQPDSLVGQALLAHELAHVVQQGRGEALQRHSRAPGEGAQALEQDADTAAVGAVVSIATGARKGLAKVAQGAMPRLKSGLRLQRCGRHDPVPKARPEIPITEESLGAHAVSCMIAANKGPHTKDSGVWYAQGYESAFPDEWEKGYAKGYANPDYWERIDTYQWRLKKGRSASAGVKAWLKGLTIAECYATAIVSEVDAVRAGIGDAKFDELFGSEDTPGGLLLELGQKGSNALSDGVLRHKNDPDIGTMGNRPAVVGEWHYFYNHPQYLLKHPAGVYQGENAMLRSDRAPNGDQLWEGLGQKKVTERQMYLNMMADYNQPRTQWDEARLDGIRKANGGKLPAAYDLKSGVFPETLKSYQEILDAPPYKIRGTERKGGYSPGARKNLDPEKVQELKDMP